MADVILKVRAKPLYLCKRKDRRMTRDSNLFAPMKLAERKDVGIRVRPSGWRCEAA